MSKYRAGGGPSTANGHISNDQRFRGDRVCPICGGAEDDQRGQGRRCIGFLCSDGEWAHCSREEFAGRTKLNPGSNAYQHKLKGKCPCGTEHAPADPKPSGAKRKRGTFDKAYPYVDEHGQILFEAVRFRDPKGFAQRRPDGQGKWLWNLSGVRLILYRLPELLASDLRETVLVVEGEKDTDRLRKLGFVATCNPMGAGKWRPEYAESLYDRKVVIIPDNDQVGREHSRQVARSLGGKALEVKLLELPDMPDHGDVSDFLDLGGSVDRLKRLISEAPPWEPPRTAQDDDGEPPIFRTDLGNASRLVKLHGRSLRYCPQWKTWLIWDGRRWKEDHAGGIVRLAKKTVRSIGAEAAEADDEAEGKALLRWALDSQSKKRIDAMVSLAWSEPGIPVEPNDLDRNPWLLNCQNGTLDLRSGELHPHRGEDLITKLAPVDYDPSAGCDLWIQVLDRVMGGDGELIGFLQRALGYAISGNVSEHAIFFLYGTGRNGKSTVLDTVLALLGDYATTVNADLITKSRNDQHPTGLCDLDGRRFVPTIEVEDGKQMAEALVKKLTGGERVKARRMKENFYEFEPTHKIFLAANHKPEIKGTDEGIWSRIKLIPFSVFIPPAERVKDLDKKLLAEEGPGILAWLVRGCLDWQHVGLAEPQAVADATESYRAEMDAVGDFLGQRCESFLDHEMLRDHARVKASDLYQAYAEWAKANGLEAMTSRKFGAEVERKGYELKKSNSQYFRIGLRLQEEPAF